MEEVCLDDSGFGTAQDMEDGTKKSLEELMEGYLSCHSSPRRPETNDVHNQRTEGSSPVDSPAKNPRPGNEMFHSFQRERDDVESESAEGTEGSEDWDDAQNESTVRFDPIVRAVEGNAEENTGTNGQHSPFRLSFHTRGVRTTSISLSQVPHYRMDTDSSPGRSESEEHNATDIAEEKRQSEEERIPDIISFADQVLHNPSSLSVQHCSTVSRPCIAPAGIVSQVDTSSSPPVGVPMSFTFGKCGSGSAEVNNLCGQSCAIPSRSNQVSGLASNNFSPCSNPASTHVRSSTGDVGTSSMRHNAFDTSWSPNNQPGNYSFSTPACSQGVEPLGPSSSSFSVPSTNPPLPRVYPFPSPRKKTPGSPLASCTPQTNSGFHSGFVGTSLSSSSACRNSPRSCGTFSNGTFSNVLSPSPSSLITLSPSSPATNITRPATSIQHAWYRDRIEKIYQDCNPSKLAHLDHLLKKKAGAEHKAYLRICKKYGVSPEQPGSFVLPVAEEKTNPCGLSVKPAGGELDFITVGALVYGLDSGMIPVRKAYEFKVHVSGPEFNTAANLADCFRLHTGICTAMVQYPIGDLIHERVRAMGVRTFYKNFEHDGVTGPNMAMVFSDRGQGLRAPVVFYNRSNEAAQKLKKGDFPWPDIFISTGTRWFHSGGLFVVLSPSLPELVLDAFHEAKRAGLVTSYELDYREKLWNLQGGLKKCQEVSNSIVANVDVLLASVEDMQLGLGISGQDAGKSSDFDPSVFSAMAGKVVNRHPNVKVVATALRQTHSTNRCSWSAVCWAKGNTYNIAPKIDLDVGNRVGGSDGFASGFASGFIYGILQGCDPEACLKMGWAHGALMMTYPGDATMATKAEVEALAARILP